MDTQQLMTKHVLARSEGSRDGTGPAVIISNELALGPSTLVDGARYETRFVDLELHERDRRRISLEY